MINQSIKMPSLEEFQADIVASRFERMYVVAKRVERDHRSKKDIAFLKVMSNGIDQKYAKHESLIGKLTAAFRKLKGEEEVPDFKTALEGVEAHHHNVLAILATHDDGAGTSLRPRDGDVSFRTPDQVNLPNINLVEFEGNARN